MSGLLFFDTNIAPLNWLFSDKDKSQPSIDLSFSFIGAKLDIGMGSRCGIFDFLTLWSEDPTTMITINKSIIGNL